MVAASRIEATTPSVPLARMFQAAEQPGLRQRHAEHLDLRAVRHERQKQGEHHERQLDHHAAQHESGRRPGRQRDGREQHGVAGEGPEALARRGHDDHDERHQRHDLGVRGEPVHGACARAGRAV